MNPKRSLIGFSEAKEGIHTFHTFNPQKNTSNEETFLVASKKEIKQALHLANKAFDNIFDYNDNDRYIFLQLIVEFLTQDYDEIKETYCKETGLNKNRFEIEFTRTINTISTFANLIKDKSWKKISSSSNEEDTPFIEKIRFPIGPVVVFGASNFPLAYSTAGGDTIAALASGCPVIVKSHPFHAGTSYLVAKSIIKANKKSKLPEGYFSHIQDNTYNAAEILIKDERIKAIGFTGSIQGGRTIYDLANKRSMPIPVFSEMGSSNPIIIFENQTIKDLNSWANIIASSICNDGGQFCTKPGLIFLPNNTNGNDFKKILINTVINKKACWMLHPTILNNYNKLLDQREKISNGKLYQNNDELIDMKGKPSILCVDIDKFIKEKSLQEEVFGPFSILISYANKIELAKALKKLHGQLTFTFIGEEKEIAENKEIIYLGIKRAGRVIFNDVPTGVKTCSSMHHGGPYPASTDSRFTAVGTDSIHRFTRPVAIQNKK